jgi:tetratricopeptide (TPR) repeat protein
VAGGGGRIAGRVAELEALDRARRDALAGRATSVVITGEAGIGKTALAAAFADRAAADGAVIIWGRAWESSWAPPFWPWTQAVRSLIDQVGEAAVLDDNPWIERLLPERDRARTEDSITEETRFFVFDALRETLIRVARVRPVVVVLDDLHAADAPTVLLTEFVTTHPGDQRVLVLATFRPREASVRFEIAEPLQRLERHADVRLPLGPLDRDEVADLVALTLGRRAAPDLVAMVADTSEGHPLFAHEILRVVSDDAAPGRPPATLPTTVAGVIGQRLAALPDDARDLLATASVIGREVDIELLAEVVGADAAGHALAVGEVEGILTAGDRGVSFSHVLLRDGLYNGLDEGERARRHQRVGEALERVRAQDLDSHLAEIARHFLGAPAPVRNDKGLVYAVAAGARARRLLAYEEAAELYRRAADVAAAAGSPKAERAELLAALGEALIRGGQIEPGRATCAEAFALADELGLFPVMARAAEWYAGMYVNGGFVDDEALRMLERALEAAGPEDSGPKALVMGRLAQELTFDEDAERRWDLAREAIAMARRTGGTRTLAETMAWVYPAMANPDIAEEALAVATETARLAVELGDLELEVRARASRTNQLLELGRVREFFAEVDWVRARVGNIGAPMLRWIADFDPVVALMRGELDTAEAAGDAALNRSAGTPQVLMAYLALRAQLAWERAELLDLEPVLVSSTQGQTRTRAVLQSMMVAARVQAGRVEEARAELDGLVAELEPAGARPLDVMGLIKLGWLSESVSLLGDDDLAARLVRLLEPYADRHVGMPMMRPAVYLGTITRHLGNLATALGRWDDAVARHRRALQLHAQVDARLYVAWSQIELARSLDGRGRSEDAREAAALHAEGSRTAGRARLTWLEGVAERSRPPHRPERAADPRAALVRRGGHWHVSYGSDEATVKDTKGVRYLVKLLRQPSVEMHSLELASDGMRATQGSAPILDAAAKAAYRSRIGGLEDEIEEATAQHDGERAAKARIELDAVMDELGRAIGIGGRDRQFANDTERARVNVTRHLKDAVARIGVVLPALGRHLGATVRTGQFCTYDATAAEVPLEWHLEE